jgi:hypothetical protein
MTLTQSATPQRVGEVIEANSHSFTAQCYELYTAPPLGSLVRTGKPVVYGVVCCISTEPLDSSRPVLARGREADTEEEIYRNNPQISRLFTSRFETLVVGHQSQNNEAVNCPYLPPLPPRVHSFVYTCVSQEIIDFTSDLQFLHLLINSGVPSADQVIGACLREASTAYSNRQEFLVRAGRTLAAELAGDLPRLNAILRRIIS